MDEKFTSYYNEELLYLRELGAEFAKAYPKIAGRLELGSNEPADPYVERLLEGFAFLTARVRLKMDAEFPRFTRRLLDAVMPNYSAQLPSMGIAKFHPDAAGGVPPGGFVVPRGSTLLSLLTRGQQTRCQFRTAQDVTLYGIEIAEATYLQNSAALANSGIAVTKAERAGISLRLRSSMGVPFNELALDTLPVYLNGTSAVAVALCEQLIADSTRVLARPAAQQATWSDASATDTIAHMGFDDDQALMPTTHSGLGAYRMLQEYFALPQRFLFVELKGLTALLQHCDATEVELVVVFDRINEKLPEIVSADNFQLFCTPIINLFEKRADRIQVQPQAVEHHVLPDRTRPMDFEVFSVEGVTGIDSSEDQTQEYRPLYDLGSAKLTGGDVSYFHVSREQRLFSSRQKQKGARSNYLGSESYLSLTDSSGGQGNTTVKQLEVMTQCTNRDLPLHMALGQGATDFDLQSGAPVDSIRCIVGPTRPKASVTDGDVVWRLINSLSVNYLSLINQHDGPAALRELLRLFVDSSRTANGEQLTGLIGIDSNPIVGRLPTPGPLCFGRGLQVRLTVDETAFEGTGAFLLGSVLDRFFARYVTMNSFAQTVLVSEQRGEIARWPTRSGTRPVL
ncbi:MAG: type VI secretion system baseplate subunit TssF [Pseudomonadota bacterium]